MARCERLGMLQRKRPDRREMRRGLQGPRFEEGYKPTPTRQSTITRSKSICAPVAMGGY